MKKLLAFLFALLATPAAAQTIPSGAWGSINYWGVGGLSQVLAPGLAGQCLTSQNVGSAPIWVNCQVSSLSLLPPINANSIMANNTLNFVAPQAIDINRVLDMVGYDIIRPPAVESIIYKSNVGPNFNWQTLPPGTSGSLLTSGGPTNPPFWAPTATQANLASICQTVGAVLYFDTPSLLWKCLNPGTSGQLLQTGGAAANPSWLTVTLATLGGVPSTRNVNTSSPLGGGGTLSADLTLTCATCTTGPGSSTTGDVALFGNTAGVPLTDAGVGVSTVPPRIFSASGIASGHTLAPLDQNVQFGGNGITPLGIVMTNPIIIGAAGSTIGSSTVGQTFSVQFTSTGLTGSPITATYTAIGGDTTATIAAGLCTAINANATLHIPSTELPIFCQSFAGSATFNIQWQASFAPSGATPLTLASTGTGTVNIHATVDQLDYAVAQIGRQAGGRTTPLAGDNLSCFVFTGASTAGFDTQYGQMCVNAQAVTSGAQQGRLQFNAASAGLAAQPIFYAQKGLVLYDSSHAPATGGDLGFGTINVPTSAALAGAPFVNVAGLFTPGNNLFGGVLAGSALNLQSTQSGSPVGDFVQITTGGALRQKWFSDGGSTMGAPTGGDLGAGFLNVAGGLSINNVAAVTAPSVKTFTNTTFDTAGAGNSLLIAGVNTATAWTAFTPTPTCGTATITSASARSKTLGKTTFIEADFTITVIGTCAVTNITFNLPNTAASGASLGGRDTNSNKGINCSVAGAGTTAACLKNDATTWNVNDHIIFSGVYENQ